LCHNFCAYTGILEIAIDGTVYEYMRLAIDIIPPKIITQYKLLLLVHNSFVYIEICKGMYGLPQAGILANKKLQKHLAQFGYKPTTHTPGLWAHQHRPVHFSLVVDDLGVKYVGKDNAQHLIDAIQSLYISSNNRLGWHTLLRHHP
jgi:hypothetical protein